VQIDVLHQLVNVFVRRCHKFRIETEHGPALRVDFVQHSLGINGHHLRGSCGGVASFNIPHRCAKNQCMEGAGAHETPSGVAHSLVLLACHRLEPLRLRRQQMVDHVHCQHLHGIVSPDLIPVTPLVCVQVVRSRDIFWVQIDVLHQLVNVFVRRCHKLRIEAEWGYALRIDDIQHSLDIKGHLRRLTILQTGGRIGR